MNTKIRLSLLLTFALVVALSAQPVSINATTARVGGNRVLAHALDLELGRVQRNPHLQLVSSGPVYTMLQASGELTRRAQAHAGPAPIPPTDFSTDRTRGCANTFSAGGNTNVRVNQDCSFRRQAEEVVAINPTNPSNLIAGQNDSRIGYNHCGYDFSFDGGRTWGDMIPPFYQTILADNHTADACSDPTATFDARGNAYIGGILFDVAADASAFVVAKSNDPYGGAFYHSPDTTIDFPWYADSPLGVIANDNDPNIFHDKEFIVADASPRSPKANNIYATWTRFNFNTGMGEGANSPINFSQSTDGGMTWSAGIEISGANPALCTAFSGEMNPNACDQDQGSHPVVGRDGTVYVAFGNGNTPVLGVNQHLLVWCPPLADCSNMANWLGPIKISDDYGTQPVGPDGGCPSGRQCLPPNDYRMDDFVQGSLSVDMNNNLYFVWNDFRNGGANCMGPDAAPPCNNDVFYAYSTDRGLTWSDAYNVTPLSGFGETAQWMPWSSAQMAGDKLFVGYYDRSYGNCEFTGCNDITLATVNNPASPNPNVNYDRLTTGSMVNLTADNNPYQSGFLGDYMWVATGLRGGVYVVWADTRGRGRGGAVDEDVYFSRR